MLRNFGKYFLIILAISLFQNQALSQTTEPDFDLNQFLTTLSGVYVSIDKPSVILSIQVNANDNSIVVIDVSGTLEFLRDIWYISEDEYKQNLTVSPMERGFIGKFQKEYPGLGKYIPNYIYAGLNPILNEQDRSSKNSIGLQSIFSKTETVFMGMFFSVDMANPIQTTYFFRYTGMFYSSFGYRKGFVKIF